MKGGAQWKTFALHILVFFLQLWLVVGKTGRLHFEADPTRSIDTVKYINRDLPFEDIEVTKKRAKGVWTQGWDINYETSDKKGTKMNAFTVMHSHNDPGWIKTFDNYYKAQTQHILTTVTEKLYDNPQYRFIWAEISFFSKWWNDQTIATKDKFIEILERGQFEFVTGGWVMNDEACAYYYAIINQLLDGHEWLQKNLNYKPKFAWSIDPFGHSATQAYFYSLIGFEAMLIQRTHYAIKYDFAWNRTLEFLWKPRWDSEASIFTHMMPFFSYDLDHTCGPEPKVCNKLDLRPSSAHPASWGTPKTKTSPLGPAFVEEYSEMMLGQYRKKSTLFRSDNVLIPMGSDFSYTSPQEWDGIAVPHSQMFKFLNNNTEKYNANLKFATLGEYFQAVAASSAKDKIKYPVLIGDFFTYADSYDHYWSGYYTSRLFSKSMDRVLEAHFRSAQLLYSYVKSQHKKMDLTEYFTKLRQASEDLSLFQHHDGITGTAREEVVVDYSTRLYKGILNSKAVIAKMISIIQDREVVSDEAQASAQNYKAQGEHTVLALENNECRTVTFFNSLSHVRSQVAEVLVSQGTITVSPLEGAAATVLGDAQIEPQIDLETGKITGLFRLVLLLKEIPAFGFAAVNVCAVSENQKGTVPHVGMGAVHAPQEGPKYPEAIPDIGATFQIANRFVELKFSSATGCAVDWQPVGNAAAPNFRFSEKFFEYQAPSSGMYLFAPEKKQDLERAQFLYMQSGSVAERLFTFYPNFVRVLTLYKTGVESIDQSPEISVHFFKWEVNKEVLVRYDTKMETEKQFYTDANGFQMQQRIRRDDLPIQFNFYPSTSAVFHEDTQARMRFNVLTRQSEAAGSTQDGALDLLLDRRLGKDDNLGLGVVIADNVPGSQVHHRLLLEDMHAARTGDVWDNELSWNAQKVSLELLNPLHIVYGAPQKQTQKQTLRTASLTAPGRVPENVHLINYRTRDLKDKAKIEVILQAMQLAVSPLFPAPQNAKRVTVAIDPFVPEQPSYAQEYSLTLREQRGTAMFGSDTLSMQPKRIRTLLVSFDPLSSTAGGGNNNGGNGNNNANSNGNNNANSNGNNNANGNAGIGEPPEATEENRNLPPRIKIAVSNNRSSFTGPPLSVWVLTFLAYLLIFLFACFTNKKLHAIALLMILHTTNSVFLFAISQSNPEFNII